MTWGRLSLCTLTLAWCLTGCAPKRLQLPTDTGSPLPDFTKVHDQVSASCRAVRTLQAELGLRGRAGGRRLSVRMVAGFERPDSMRLEGLAPIGQPLFILVAQGASGILLLPRESRVLRGHPAEAILDALIGIDLAPGDLLAILTGCVVPGPTPSAGRMHANGWTSIDLGSSATLFLRRTSQWQVRAARRDGWQLEYVIGQSRFPEAVRLVADSTNVQVDLTATVSQLETNVDLSAAAFHVDVPPDADPLTLEELRKSGPLGTP